MNFTEAKGEALLAGHPRQFPRVELGHDAFAGWLTGGEGEKPRL